MCLTPIYVRQKMDNTKAIPLDCGKCPDCVRKRTAQWSFRLRKEAENSHSAHFLTLTYNTEHIPFTETGLLTLKPDDVTLWLKRLRKQHAKRNPDYPNLKYFYCGEYGGKTERPHYHMLLFNAKVEDVEDTWNYGAVHYGTVTPASIGYCLKYMIKDGLITDDEREPEFARMSKGIGAAYLTAENMYWHTEKRAILDRMYTVADGKKIALSRFYKQKIFDKLHMKIVQNHATHLHEERERQLAQIDAGRKAEADKNSFKKMLASKYKNKYI